MPPYDRIELFLREALERGIFPGVSLLVAQAGQPLHRWLLGAACTQGEARPLTDRTRMDLASLTKALGTTTAAMLALGEGRAELEEPLGDRLTLPLGLARQPAWHLLGHASGLPAWAPLYQELDEEVRRGAVAHDREARRGWLRARAARTPLETPPGEHSVYSDLGFMVLDWWLETIFGERLDRVLKARLFDPLGLAQTGYVDLDAPRADPPEAFAATELCPYRGRMISGEVHDLNTWAMGGVSGQAGLFSTAEEVHRLLLALWSAWRGAPGPVPGAVVQRFWEPAPVPGSSFRLGWDGPSSTGYSAAGRRMPREAVGHLGFTGCSLWLVPSTGFWVILLTNRIHPSVDNVGIREFRPALHDLVLEELGLGGDP